MISCQFCGFESSKKCGMHKHLRFCSKAPQAANRTVLADEVLYKLSRNILEHEYVILQKGLRAIERERNIPYRALRRLAKHYGFLRSSADSVRLQNEKNKALFLEKYGVVNPFQIPEVIDKIQNKRDARAAYSKAAETNRKKYGVSNSFQIPSVIDKIQNDPKAKATRGLAIKKAMSKKTREEWALRTAKIEKTNLKRYGVCNPFQIPAVIEGNKTNTKAHLKRRATCERLGLWKTEDEKTAFEQYFCAVRKITRRNRKVLFARWDGFCFYTKEILVTNGEFKKQNPNIHIARNPLRPTVDHKISVMRGFKTGVPASEIGALENLCVCSQRANSQKGYRTMIEFLKERASDV